MYMYTVLHNVLNYVYHMPERTNTALPTIHKQIIEVSSTLDIGISESSNVSAMG